MAISIQLSSSLIFFMLFFLVVMPTKLCATRSFLQAIQQTNFNKVEGGRGALKTPSDEMISLSAVRFDGNAVKGFRLHVLAKGIVRGSGPSHKGHQLQLFTADRP
ncbi:hypothetical protein L1887_34429 [Cichorium endivia]|nr:hypothetical protein L1887_34429 [Cichorium endivia]